MIDRVADFGWELALLLGVGIGGWVGASRAQGRVRQADSERARLEEQLEACRTRLRAEEQTTETLRRTLLQIPEIAQRLVSTPSLREIPQRALDLVEELFDPAFSVFYRMGREDLIAVAARGESEYEVGHRLRPGEGVVGYCAKHEIALTREDTEALNPRIYEDHLSRCWPRKGFSVALPVLEDDRLLGVMLVGRSDVPNAQVRELGRTVALASSVAITRTEALNRQRHLAQTDGLTGLLNKTHVLGQLRKELRSSVHQRSSGSVFLFDIDHFKTYNDTNGHLPGDELLKTLADVVRSEVRETEFVGRYGGEEFLVVMPGASKERALSAAERVRRAIQDHAFSHRENQPGGRVTVSGGVASWPGDGDDPATLIRRADEALYASKQAGRNRVTAWSIPDLADDDRHFAPEIDAQAREIDAGCPDDLEKPDPPD